MRQQGGAARQPRLRARHHSRVCCAPRVHQTRRHRSTRERRLRTCSSMLARRRGRLRILRRSAGPLGQSLGGQTWLGTSLVGRRRFLCRGQALGSPRCARMFSGMRIARSPSQRHRFIVSAGFAACSLIGAVAASRPGRWLWLDPGHRVSRAASRRRRRAQAQSRQVVCPAEWFGKMLPVAAARSGWRRQETSDHEVLRDEMGVDPPSGQSLIATPSCQHAG